MICLDSRRKKPETLTRQHPNALILDVTSRGPEPWVRFSPFYPHGGIPVPFFPGKRAQSVEGVWQALKVFEHEGVDFSKLTITTMKGLKRSTRSRGRVMGHQASPEGVRLVDYVTARRLIYLPCYQWILDNALRRELALLEEQASERQIVLLDYETNADILDTSRPLSHAALIKAYVEHDWPDRGSVA